MLYEKFRHGINLGGWLSQYEIITMSEEEEICDAHFKSFITQDDQTDRAVGVGSCARSRRWPSFLGQTGRVPERKTDGLSGSMCFLVCQIRAEYDH